LLQFRRAAFGLIFTWGSTYVLAQQAIFKRQYFVAISLFPWQEEALSVATHKPNVYIDLSGWSPKYFPPILVRYINSILQDKMLFGSDWPVITPDRWLSDFAKLDIREEIRPKVLKANARKLLGI
jgi:predicted TIM-barrel fold metal-dependent hydrolase